MRQQTRILAGIGLLALGLGAWYFVFSVPQDAAERPAGVPLARLEQQNESETETVLDFRPERRSEPMVGENSRSGASASPPPLALPNLEERSFRPPIENLSPPVTERRGLAAPDSPYPFLAHAADPLGEEPDEAEAARHGESHPGRATEAAGLIDEAEVEAAPELSPEMPAATTPVVAEAEPRMIEHVIQPGDTYSSLAVKYLGGVRHTRLIEEANRGKDPRRLFVGSKVNIPAAPSTTVADAPSPALEAAVSRADMAREPLAAVSTAAAIPPIPAERSYQVQPGETWSDLARKFFGDANQWPRLYELNKDRVVRDPNALRAGTTIELPPGVIASTSP
jgi:nucleoid-associated protein YgaU